MKTTNSELKESRVRTLVEYITTQQWSTQTCMTHFGELWKLSPTEIKELVLEAQNRIKESLKEFIRDPEYVAASLYNKLDILYKKMSGEEGTSKHMIEAIRLQGELLGILGNKKTVGNDTAVKGIGDFIADLTDKKKNGNKSTSNEN